MSMKLKKTRRSQSPLKLNPEGFLKGSSSPVGSNAALPAGEPNKPGEGLPDLRHIAGSAAEKMKEVCEILGIDVQSNSTIRTPERFINYLTEFLQYMDLAEVLGPAFESRQHSMVVQTNIPFRMICEHHLLPAIGRASLGYVPQKKVVGLSKLTRLVQAVGTEKPSLQEHICDRIADLLHTHIEPLGTMCIIEAEHGCMSCRGINTPGVKTITSCPRGIFLTNPQVKNEFLALIRGS